MTPDASDNNKYSEFRKWTNKVVSLLYGSVTPVIQSYIIGITDPKEMWTTLQKRMDIVQNESGSTYMRDKFHQEKYKPEDTIDQYIGRLLSYQERLVGTKQSLTDRKSVV